MTSLYSGIGKSFGRAEEKVKFFTAKISIVLKKDVPLHSEESRIATYLLFNYCYLITKKMSLESKIMEALKEAMKAKDTIALESLRAVKSAILLAKTEASAGDTLSAEEEIKLLQRLVKQRKESAELYQKQGREDLATPELAQAEIIAKFLPEQLSEEAVETAIRAIVARLGASSMKDMGKVMGEANKELAGKADGKLIATVVKRVLS